MFLKTNNDVSRLQLSQSTFASHNAYAAMYVEESLAEVEEKSPGLTDAFIEDVVWALTSVSLGETAARDAVSRL